MAKNPEKYMLVHTHQYGDTVYFFEYVPTDEMPYPDIRKLTERLTVDYEPAKDESLSLTNLVGEECPLLTAAEVGSPAKENPCGPYYAELG